MMMLLSKSSVVKHSITTTNTGESFPRGTQKQSDDRDAILVFTGRSQKGFSSTSSSCPKKPTCEFDCKVCSEYLDVDCVWTMSTRMILTSVTNLHWHCRLFSTRASFVASRFYYDTVAC